MITRTFLTACIIGLFIINTSCEEANKTIPEVSSDNDSTLINNQATEIIDTTSSVEINEEKIGKEVLNSTICNCNIALNYISKTDEGVSIDLASTNVSDDYNIDGAKMIGYDAESKLFTLTDVRYLIFTEGQNMIYLANEISEPDTIKASFWIEEFTLKFANNKIYSNHDQNSSVITEVKSNMSELEFDVLDCHENWLKISTYEDSDDSNVGWIQIVKK